MIRRSALGVLGGPLALGFGFHPLEPLVVVGEFLHVRQRDLAGEDRIVVGDVGLRVVAAVLELDVHTGAELLEIEAAPVDADRVADAPRLLERSCALLGHRLGAYGGATWATTPLTRTLNGSLLGAGSAVACDDGADGERDRSRDAVIPRTGS